MDAAAALEEIGHRRVVRAPLDEALRAAEEVTLAGLAAVREALRHAVRTVTASSAEEADRAVARATELHERYDDVHERLLAVIARQAPVASDLRLAIALLHVNDRLERMSAQCVNIITLCRAFPANEAPSEGQLECLRTMAELADEQMAEAGRVFDTRDVEGARRLGQHDLGINERNRRCFDLAVHERAEESQREVALMVAMMARAIERIGDNAVDIGRQAAFVATGRLERSSLPAA
jgi:phosphate transport system protein